MIACYKGHFKIAKYLIDIGADVNRKSVKGNTALHDCAESGSLEIMKLLISSGARIDVDAYGMTPLLAASVTGMQRERERERECVCVCVCVCVCACVLAASVTGMQGAGSRFQRIKILAKSLQITENIRIYLVHLLCVSHWWVFGIFSLLEMSAW